MWLPRYTLNPSGKSSSLRSVWFTITLKGFKESNWSRNNADLLTFLGWCCLWSHVEFAESLLECREIATYHGISSISALWCCCLQAPEYRDITSQYLLHWCSAASHHLVICRLSPLWYSRAYLSRAASFAEILKSADYMISVALAEYTAEVSFSTILYNFEGPLCFFLFCVLCSYIWW